MLFFAKDANGNVSPAGEITGPKTMLGSIPAGLAMDSHGNIYVANNTSNTITVYAAGAEGNVAPRRTITGTKTRLNQPTGLAIDSQDRLYVANSQTNTMVITIYAPNANGNAAPVRTIGGKQYWIEFTVGRRRSIRSRTCTLPMKPNTAGSRFTLHPRRAMRHRNARLTAPLPS